MQVDDYGREERTRLDSEPGTRDRGLFLYVIDGPDVASHPLPDSGEVVLGRTNSADIVVEGTSISRRHLLLRTGDTIEVEDLGSANGTFVGGVRLPVGHPVEIAPGELIELGPIMALVQRRFTAPPSHTVCDHGYFEQRVQEECDRGREGTSPFSVVRLRFRAGAVSSGSISGIARALSTSAVVGSFGPNDFEVLVSGGEDAVTTVVRRMSRRLGEGAFDWGAAHYPIDGRNAQALLARASERVRGDGPPLDDSIIVESQTMIDLHRLAGRVAQTDINVLLLGETGVGKEVVAQRIHEASARAEKPLLRLCCASLSPTLMESELFGHVKGAFTGAFEDRAGLLESANGGTVFLDEIGELSLTLQTKLLRVLEERRVRRVGSVDARAIDVRFVAATNRDLEAEVAAGRFREDLYYRLNGFSLVIPPLRERVDDIEPLARLFVAQVGGVGISDCAIEALRRYAWPGNVRELRNTLERAIILAGDGPIRPEHLPAAKMADRAGRTGGFDDDDDDESLDLRAGIEAAERRLIRRALDRADGNQTEAAKLLGVSRQTLISRLDAYGMPRPRKSTRHE